MRITSQFDFLFLLLQFYFLSCFHLFDLIYFSPLTSPFPYFTTCTLLHFFYFFVPFFTYNRLLLFSYSDPSLLQPSFFAPSHHSFQLPSHILSLPCLLLSHTHLVLLLFLSWFLLSLSFFSAFLYFLHCLFVFSLALTQQGVNTHTHKHIDTHAHTYILTCFGSIKACSYQL